MPVVKAAEPLGQRPVILVLFGEPFVFKTSLLHTCKNPLLLDFDRGVDRSFGRKDALVIDSWEEVLKEEADGTFKKYDTIGIDTAKAALDDFLMVYVTKQDYKLATNKLKAFGEIGDKFKLFVNNRRAERADIVILAHAKKDEDTKRIIPDVTGQSYNLLMRIADQVGYMRTENNQPVISFSPTDLTVGKNVAGLPLMVLPDKGTAAWRTFGADLIAKIKESLATMSEEQREALEKSDKFRTQIAECESPDDLTALLALVRELPQYLSQPLVQEVSAKAKAKGWRANKESARYEVGGTPTTTAATPAETAQQQQEQKPETPAEVPTQNAPEEAGEKPAAETEELTDSSGLSWDARIHSSEKTKTETGLFRRKCGITEEYFREVETELRGGKEASPATPPTIPAAPVAPNPEKMAAARAAMEEPAPPAPVAQKQSEAWFAERVGKIIFWQGAPGREDHYTGPQVVEHEGYPAWMAGDLQADGYTFRDLLPSDPQEVPAGEEEAQNA